MRLSCPSCGGGFEIGEEPSRATARCPTCGRVVVVRDATLVSPQGEATVPHDAERAGLDPGTRADLTAVGAPGLSLPAGRRVSLAFLSGPRQGDVLTLDRPRFLLGRGAGADVSLDDPDVSRAHAVVECQGAHVVLKDAGSRFGTFVGDERIEERELEDRTEFRLGSTRVLLILSDAE